jgi:putative ABC transport system permease protein
MNAPAPFWFLRMAWRDSRGSRTHLLLSMAALAIGIGALVAIRSFGERLDQAIDLQTRNLLGADYSVRALHPFNDSMNSFLETLPGDSVRETRFFSMVVFPKNEGTRLSHVRALSGPFPFYGGIVAEPADRAHVFLEDRSLALVEESLLLQFDAEIGDPIQIGTRTFTIAGRLLNVSGESPATSTFIGPRIYISMDAVPETELIREGTLARYYAHYRLNESGQAESIRTERQRELADLRLEMETAEQRKAMMGNRLENLYRYLNLGAFIALLLGGIGCAGSVHLYARRKSEPVAILRCLGASARSAFSIYVAQVCIAALLGALLGAVLGTALQGLIPLVLADFLPVEIDASWSPASILVSMFMGLTVSIAFTLLPLVSLRRIPPMAAIRPRSADDAAARFDPARAVVTLLLGVILLTFAIIHSDRWFHGIGLVLGLALVFALLTSLAQALMRLARRFLRHGWPFTWRQGIANIHRPNNQTTVLLLALGLGAFLLTTLALTQSNLLRQFQQTDRDGQPNLVLFDVQPDQVAHVIEQIDALGLELLETSPIVTMRLIEVDGRTVGDLRDDPERDIPHWVLFREYRTTYREPLLPRDRVTQGRWMPYTDPTAPIPISAEERLMEHLGTRLGSVLTFDVHGVRMQTVITSVRRVDWREMRTNFFVIFPAGVLEDAPQYYALVTRTPTAADAARLQHTLIAAYPNISAVDLRMLVSSIDEILDKAAFVIRFMALFSVFTGLLVLGGTVVTSRYDRREETQLLRILGASKQQLNRIMTAEYLILGSIASLAGVTLALVASWAFARWVFRMNFVPAWAPLLYIPLIITVATLLVGRLLTPRNNPSS